MYELSVLDGTPFVYSFIIWTIGRKIPINSTAISKMLSEDQIAEECGEFLYLATYIYQLNLSISIYNRICFAIRKSYFSFSFFRTVIL